MLIYKISIKKKNIFEDIFRYLPLNDVQMTLNGN